MLLKFVNFVLKGAERFNFLDGAGSNIFTRFLNSSEGRMSSSPGCLFLFPCFVGEDVFLVVTIGSAYCFVLVLLYLEFVLSNTVKCYQEWYLGSALAVHCIYVKNCLDQI